MADDSPQPRARKSFKEMLAENEERRKNTKMGKWMAENQAEREAWKAERDAAKQAKALRYCPGCRQNVAPVRRFKAGTLVAFGAIGAAATKKNSCPICRREDLEDARPELDDKQPPTDADDSKSQG